MMLDRMGLPIWGMAPSLRSVPKRRRVAALLKPKFHVPHSRIAMLGIGPGEAADVELS